MTLTIPNIEASPTFDAQAVPDSTDWAAMAAAVSRIGVASGCAVTPHGADMNVAVAAGTVLVSNALVNVTAVASLAIGAASATDRRDIVVVNSSGVVSVVAGTACGTAGWTRTSTGLPPVKPAIPASSVLLAEVYVGSSTTTIASGNIVDKTAQVGLQLVTTAEMDADLASGVIAQTVRANRVPLNISASLLTSGQLYFASVYLRAGQTISTCTWYSGTQAAGTPVNQWAALYSGPASAPVLLVTSSDRTSTAWGAFTAQTFTFATPYVVLTSGIYYVGLMVKATTTPNLVTVGPITGVGNPVLNPAPVLSGTSTSGLTDPASAPNPAASITFNYMPVVRIS